MVKTLCSVLLVSAALVIPARASLVFSDSFSYPDGPLIGQGSWTITGSSTVNPVQVTSGQVNLATSGQDVNGDLTANINNVAGTSFYVGFTLRLSAAQTGGGDYFLHVSPNAGNTTSFYGRLFATTEGSGFKLGYLETSGGTTTFGTSALSFNTDYRVVLAYNFVSGAINDTASLYIDPTSSIEANNTPYLTDAWTSATAEPSVVGAINLRQGSSAIAPTLLVDELMVATTFADVAIVPEPGTFALIGLAGCALALRRRKA